VWSIPDFTDRIFESLPPDILHVMWLGEVKHVWLTFAEWLTAPQRSAVNEVARTFSHGRFQRFRKVWARRFWIRFV